MANLPSIGRPLARPEDRALVTGAARFGAEVSLDSLPSGGERLCHVVFVRSPFAHAELGPIDAAAAASAPGVVGVFTAVDLDVHPAGRFAAAIHSIFAQPLLAELRARYVGEPVAAVVARSAAEAVDAAELVGVEFTPLPPVLDLDDALSGSTLLFESHTAPRLAADAPVEEPHAGGNVAVAVDWQGSDRSAPTPFDAADVVLERRFMNPRMSPAPMETRTVTCEWPEDGPLVVLASTQRPHGHRDELCRLYRLEQDEVLVIAPEVGGGFGGKNSRTAEELLMPFLAKRIGAPVTWTETRSEYLAAATQGRGERLDMTLAGTRDGRIEAVRTEMVKDCGAYPITGAVLPGGFTVYAATGPYDIAHAEFSARCVATNRVPTSAFRGAGRAPYTAALERIVDLFAAEIGMDPAEVRRRNLVKPDQMPYESPTGAVYDDADYPADLEAALSLIDYVALRREQQLRNGADAVRRLGIGIACYNHMTVGGGGEEASVTILPDGGARIATGSTSQGHGHTITWAQIASDVLGIPVERIEVVEGRTDVTATGVGAVGSRSVQTAGIAVHHSATEVVELARQLAADMFEASVDDVMLDRAVGHFHVVGTPARAITWADVATRFSHREEAELSCGEFFDNEGRNTFPSGTHIAVVEVDVETGALELLRFAAVDDAGVVINPMLVEGQLHGGIASGIGQAIGETVRYDDDGNLRTPTFVEYQLPTADELPSFELALSAVPTSFNELGVKGVGESGTIGATPAVHNAVIDALRPLGVDHIELPCTAERVWAAIADSAPTSIPRRRRGNFVLLETEGPAPAGPSEGDC